MLLILMIRKRSSFIWALILLSSFYLIYQIYNLTFDIKYHLLGTLGLNIISSFFLLLSSINIFINVVFIVKLYHLKSDMIRWLHIFFAYNILEILIATVYLMLAFSYFPPNFIDYIDLLMNLSPQILFVLSIMVSLWIVIYIYLKKENKISSGRKI